MRNIEQIKALRPSFFILLNNPNPRFSNFVNHWIVDILKIFHRKAMRFNFSAGTGLQPVLFSFLKINTLHHHLTIGIGNIILNRLEIEIRCACQTHNTGFSR